MQEFLQIRETLDCLIDEAKSRIQKKSIADPREPIEQAQELINKLKQVATAEQQSFVAKRA